MDRRHYRTPLFWLFLILLFPCLSLAVSAAELNLLIADDCGYTPQQIEEALNQYRQRNPGLTLKVRSVRYEDLEREILNKARSGTYDVILSDAPWTARLARDNLVRPLPSLSAAVVSDIEPAALDAGAYQGKNYGFPWITDQKILFFNRRILEQAGYTGPPRTLGQMLDQARTIKAKGQVRYPIAWAWDERESLTCDFLILAHLFGQAPFRSTDQRLMINQDAWVKAIEFMKQTLDEGLANPASLNWIEDNVYDSFIKGEHALSFNWTFVHAIALDPSRSRVANDTGIAIIPGHGNVSSASINGGMPLAIAQGSRNPVAAWDLIRHLSSLDFQRKNADTVLPIYRSLYLDSSVQALQPELIRVFREQYPTMKNRPPVPWYPEFSRILRGLVRSALQGRTSPANAVVQMRMRLSTLENRN